MFVVVALVALVQYGCSTTNWWPTPRFSLPSTPWPCTTPTVGAIAAGAVLEVGVAMASLRWDLAGSSFRSFVFLSAMVVAALFVGLTVRAGSAAPLLADRAKAERLELDRDQQAAISAAAERARIAREMHDVVTHSLSVVVRLADAASVVSHADPQRASDAMEQVAGVGRRALADMRTIVGVLGPDDRARERAPQPDLGQLDDLFEQVQPQDSR